MVRFVMTPSATFLINPTDQPYEPAQPQPPPAPSPLLIIFVHSQILEGLQTGRIVEGLW